MPSISLWKQINGSGSLCLLAMLASCGRVELQNKRNGTSSTAAIQSNAADMTTNKGGACKKDAPSLMSISPATGPVGGGTSVTLSGSNFCTGMSVKFGETLAGGITVNSTSQAIAVTPPGASGIVTVTVSNPQTSAASLVNGFQYVSSPEVSPSVSTAPTAGSGTLLASHTFTAGWATFGQAIPQGILPPGMSLQVGAYPTQTDILTTYADGSAKFAVVTARITTAGTFPVKTIPAPLTGKFTPVVPKVALVLDQENPFQVLGTVTPSSSSLSVTLGGGSDTFPVMVAGAVRVIPVDNSSSAVVINALDPGYSETGSGWTTSSFGYNGHSRIAGVFSSGTAQWNFSGLTAGKAYQVAMSWAPVSHARTPTWTIFDSNGTTSLATGSLDQRQGPKSDIAATDKIRWSAVMPASPTEDNWLGSATSGPLVREWRSIVTPVNDAGQQHPFVRIFFDTRIYNDGMARISVRAENTLNVAGATNFPAAPTLYVNDNQVWSHAAVGHAWRTVWRTIVNVGNWTPSAITYDWSAHQAAHAWPLYAASIDATPDTENGDFDILQKGAIPNNEMDEGGLWPYIGPLPRWAARYIVHQDPAQLAYMLDASNLQGSWNCHLRNPDGSILKLTDAGKSDFWADPRSGQLAGDLAVMGYSWDQAHQPALSLVSYLVTGDRYYHDELIMAAAFDSEAFTIRIAPYVMWADPTVSQVRSLAWALRENVYAASWGRDGDRDYAGLIVKSNLAWLDAYAASVHTPPFQGKWLALRPGTTGGPDPSTGTPQKSWVAHWEHAYLTYAIDYANRQGFKGGEVMRDSILSFYTGLFNNDPAYPKEYAGVYVPAVATPAMADPTKVTNWYTSWAQVYQATYADYSLPPDDFGGGEDQTINMMLAIAANRNIPGAASALTWLLDHKYGTITVRQDLETSYGGWYITGYAP